MSPEISFGWWLRLELYLPWIIASNNDCCSISRHAHRRRNTSWTCGRRGKLAHRWRSFSYCKPSTQWAVRTSPVSSTLTSSISRSNCNIISSPSFILSSLCIHTHCLDSRCQKRPQFISTVRWCVILTDCNGDAVIFASIRLIACARC